MNEVNEELRESEENARQATKQVQELDKKIKEMSSTQENEIYQYTKQIEELQISLQHLKEGMQEKDQKIEDLEVLIRSYESEIELLKKVNKASSNEKEDINAFKEQIETLEVRNRKTEESYKKRVDELIKQNSDAKRELEYVKGLLSDKERESENTMAQIGMENEKMKRQIKELNAKILTMQYDNNESRLLKDRIEELQIRNETVETQLSDAKVYFAYLKQFNILVEINIICC